MSSMTPDILVTTIYFCATLLLAEAGRRASRFFLQPCPLLESGAQEFIAAFELCAICYEINILFEYPFGTLLYFFYLFVASAWWILTWESATASPYSALVSYLIGDLSLSKMAILIPAQLAGGLVFYQYYTKPLWDLGYGDIHADRASNDLVCYSDIQSAVPVAALVEGAGVFLTILTGKVVATKFDENVTAGVEAFVSTALVIAAINVSGGYYNPVLATATQFGCFGSTVVEHFVVYWIGESVGAVLAQLMWQQVIEEYLTTKSKSD